LKEIVISSRRFAYSAVNFAQVRQNWLIGQRIVKQEQHGKARAEYGKHIIEIASKALTAEFGKGFSLTNIENFKSFYLTFNDLQIDQSLPDQSKTALPLLSWTHYEHLLRVKNDVARNWYLQEAVRQTWSYRTLDRNISTLYYRRLLSSQTQEIVEQEMKDKTNVFQNDNLEFIKNPAVLEFLGLPANNG
jgi:hypothetical protein